jgi:Response regulators consisting of a CheY-like receiver domain and a winged-helix DNA-binding domain
MNLLLVEDDLKLAEALIHIFKKQGYVVDDASDGEVGMDMAATGIYDVIVLDRMLPSYDGMILLKEYRSMGFDTPVLLLTAKDSPQDLVEGLDAGADDYLIKPFYVEELLARVRAMTRRQSSTGATKSIRLADIVLEPHRGIVTKNREKISLTVKEAELLELLMRNSGRVISNDFILERVWGNNSTVNIPYVHLYIHHLRKKLNTNYIKTVPKVGYIFLTDQEPSSV